MTDEAAARHEIAKGPTRQVFCIPVEQIDNSRSIWRLNRCKLLACHVTFCVGVSALESSSFRPKFHVMNSEIGDINVNSQQHEHKLWHRQRRRSGF